MKLNIIIIGVGIVGTMFGGTLAIDQFGVDGGGGTSAGGRFSVTGAVRPEDSSKMKGGNFGVEAAFLSLVTVVQTPGAPTLRLVMAGNIAILSWPVSESSFRLEANSNLTLLNGWANVIQSATTNNGTVSVQVPLAPGNKFFRLKR